MDPFECKLAEQVRRYKHLYDPSQRAHRDGRVALKSWRKIASTLQREEAFCRKAWKNTRDRFVKAKKRTRGKGGVNKGVPSILVELEWLSRFVKHRVVDSDFNLEDDGAELNNEVQKTPGNSDTQDSTEDYPPVSPSSYSASPSALAEMTSCGSPSPSVRDSPSPLTLLTAAATQSINSCLLSPVPHHVPSPKAPASPRTTDCVLCAEHQDQERQKITQQDNADSRFVEVIKDMLANVNPVHKPDVKFKIYQLLFEAEKDFPRES
ncbi:uncharacterized protein LOC109141174 [Larimichthys crocea]|uniref:Uncharacterized protein n=1 Tax=Larimichthys crocea TaxID=215358 RepID=A0ACD3QYQ7_LARCR|nr:uncharacterized protein LOC109141174 [Larimichthys crocea]TMS12283.1 hypothetical protein E3U43_017241 [Larimichthys crocea]